MEYVLAFWIAGVILAMWKIWIPAYKLIAKVAPDNILVTRPIIASIVCVFIFTLTLPIYALALIVPSKLENFTSGFVKGALGIKNNGIQ